MPAIDVKEPSPKPPIDVEKYKALITKTLYVNALKRVGLEVSVLKLVAADDGHRLDCIAAAEKNILGAYANAKMEMEALYDQLFPEPPRA